MMREPYANSQRRKRLLFLEPFQLKYAELAVELVGEDVGVDPVEQVLLALAHADMGRRLADQEFELDVLGGVLLLHLERDRAVLGEAIGLAGEKRGECGGRVLEAPKLRLRC